MCSEKDLDEVLQTETVYHNVSKGVLATSKELQEAFGTTDQRTICLEVLAKGELQVSDKERKVEFDNLFKDVASEWAGRLAGRRVHVRVHARNAMQCSIFTRIYVCTVYCVLPDIGSSPRSRRSCVESHTMLYTALNTFQACCLCWRTQVS